MPQERGQKGLPGLLELKPEKSSMASVEESKLHSSETVKVSPTGFAYKSKADA